jgi:hypothetical protein
MINFTLQFGHFRVPPGVFIFASGTVCKIEGTT